MLLPHDPKSFRGPCAALPCSSLPPVTKVPTSANPGLASCWVWLSRGEGKEGEGRRGEGRSTRPRGIRPWEPRLSGGQSRRPSSPQPLSGLEAPPGLRWGELIHVPHLVVGLVAHGEQQLVAETNLLLLGVGKEQDLGDG